MSDEPTWRLEQRAGLDERTNAAQFLVGKTVAAAEVQSHDPDCDAENVLVLTMTDGTVWHVTGGYEAMSEHADPEVATLAHPFSLGDVVEMRPEHAEKMRVHPRSRRGVVVFAHGKGASGALLMGHCADTIAVQISDGHHHVTDFGGRVYEKVPDAEQSRSERVRSAMWTYHQWWNPGEDHSDSDEWEWHLSSALLRPDEVDRVFSDLDWPTDYGDLFIRIADALDHSDARWTSTRESGSSEAPR